MQHDDLDDRVFTVSKKLKYTEIGSKKMKTITFFWAVLSPSTRERAWSPYLLAGF